MANVTKEDWNMTCRIYEVVEELQDVINKAYWATVCDDPNYEGKTARGWIVEAERTINDFRAELDEHCEK